MLLPSIDHLRFEEADVMGFSLGGGVALRTAIQHPRKARKLVLVSTPFKRNGWYPEVLAAMAQSSPESAEGMKVSPMYEVYSRIAPRVEDWPVLFAKLGALLRQDYDWSTEVAAMKTPTMLAIGDADSVRTSHAVEFFELLGGGKKDAGWDGSGMSSARLFVLPGITHYNIFDAPALAAAVVPFLETPCATMNPLLRHSAVSCGRPLVLSGFLISGDTTAPTSPSTASTAKAGLKSA